jgi:hypothetical protein
MILLLVAPALACTHNGVPLVEDDDGAALLWPRLRVDIRQVHNVVSGCLPSGERSITLQTAAVASIDAGWPPPEWAIELISDAKPMILRAGECISFGSLPQGYKQIGGMQPLEVGHTYGFALLRGNPRKEGDRRYLGIFCIQRQPNGRLAYLPYIDHPDGTITYPPCGRYMGGPPAPDGVVPKDSP